MPFKRSRKPPYSIAGALFVEVFLLTTRHKPDLKSNKLLARMADYWWPDWVQWKAERAMNGVDEQIADIVEQWEKEHDNSPVFSEESPDGSEAQRLLGGPMRSRRPWVDK